MNPHSKTRPLIFTPRSPWGRLPLKRTAQNHMRASEDRKTDTYGQGMDQLKTRAESPGDVARDMNKNGVPPTLQGQISPARAEDISYASQKFPKNPRMPKTPSELGLDPNHLSPQPAPPGQSLPTRTNEQMDDQARRWGGHGKSMPEPGQKWNLPEWLKYLPSVEHSSEYDGAKWSLPLGKKKKEEQ